MKWGEEGGVGVGLCKSALRRLCCMICVGLDIAWDAATKFLVAAAHKVYLRNKVHRIIITDLACVPSGQEILSFL
jgi:hypothetical protein